MTKRIFQNRKSFALETRLLEETGVRRKRDFFGFIEASIEEIHLLRHWCGDCIDGIYPNDDRAKFTLLMEMHRPSSEWSRDFLIGTVKPGSYHWRSSPCDETFPDQGEAA